MSEHFGPMQTVDSPSTDLPEIAQFSASSVKSFNSVSNFRRKCSKSGLLSRLGTSKKGDEMILPRENGLGSAKRSQLFARHGLS